MALQQWKSRAHRWQQLTRYYVNKWHYDGSKWAERVWYGQPSRAPNAVASVPFMITRSMRAELEQLGFPSGAIAALLPQQAHQLLAEKVSYAQFQALSLRTSAEAESASATKRDAAALNEIKEIVAVIEAREREEEAAAHVAGADAHGVSTSVQLALVPETETATETQHGKGVA